MQNFTLRSRGCRLLAGNRLVIGLGTLTYLILRDLAHWAPDAISAACGCVIGAVLVVAMLFDGWPAARLRPGPSRALTLAGAGIILHTGIGLRWPFTPKTMHDPSAIREYWPVLAPRAGGR